MKKQTKRSVFLFFMLGCYTGVMQKTTEAIHVRPSWDEYFMSIAELVGSRGTCDRGRAGTVTVKNKRILTTGYVGSPVGLPSCDEEGHELHTVISIRTTHSEQNAIVQAARVGVSLDGATLFTHMAPCYVCAKLIINVGIVRVVCGKDYHAAARSKEIFKEAGVLLEVLSSETETYDNM
jgi:dCMP deaminase